MNTNININASTVKPVEHTLPSEATKIAPKKGQETTDVRPQENIDTAEVSSHAQYMNKLRDLPDVRPDVVANVRHAVYQPVIYPPLDIISAIGNLIGNDVKP